MSDDKLLIVGFTESDLAEQDVDMIEGSQAAGQCAACGKDIMIGPGSWNQMDGVPKKRLRLLCMRDYRRLEGHPD